MKPVEEPPPAPRRPGAVPMIPDVQPAPRPADEYAHLGAPASDSAPNPKATLKEYLYSILYMPHSMRMVCLTNLFCWMAHVCYSLYFTDFVGEAVYGGDPKVCSLRRARHLRLCSFRSDDSLFAGSRRIEGTRVV